MTTVSQEPKNRKIEITVSWKEIFYSAYNVNKDYRVTGMNLTMTME